MVSLQVFLLGRLQVFDRTQTLITLPLKAQELFVYLFIYGNRPHEREKLSAQLWPDIPENRSKKYLRQALWQLQTSLNDSETAEDSIVQLDGSWVQLHVNNHIWVDANQFHQTFSLVRDVLAEQMTAEQADLIIEAVALYQGDLVAGWYQDWCFLERERYQSMLLAMLDKLIDYCLINRQFERGIEFAMQVLRYDQARERSHRRLMRLYYLADNRTAALRQYELCAAALERELNVQPSQKTTALYRQIQADNGRDLAPLSLLPAPVTNSRSDAGLQFIALLQSIHADMQAMQQDMNSLRQALNYLKDASADI